MFTIMAFTAIIAFTSCSDSNDSLSSSTAKSLVKDELKRQHELVGAFSIRVGYFECNDDVTRYQYKQLAANELITYKHYKYNVMIDRNYRNPVYQLTPNILATQRTLTFEILPVQGVMHIEGRDMHSPATLKRENP